MIKEFFSKVGELFNSSDDKMYKIYWKAFWKFVLITFLWRGMEFLLYGQPTESAEDTIIGIFLWYYIFQSERRKVFEEQQTNLEKLYTFASVKYSEANHYKRKIGDVLEATKPFVCDQVCKWPCECSGEEEMNKICEKCLFDKNSDKIMEYVKK